MRLFIIKIAMSVLLACGGNEDYGPDAQTEVEPEPIRNIETKGAASALNCPKGTQLSYENLGKALLASYCTMCHSSELAEEQRAGAPPLANFDSARDVAVWRAAILDRIKSDAKVPMPPGKNLSDNDRGLLEEWLNCGAPERMR